MFAHLEWPAMILVWLSGVRGLIIERSRFYHLTPPRTATARSIVARRPPEIPRHLRPKRRVLFITDPRFARREATVVSEGASYRAVGFGMAIAGVVCFSLRPILIKVAYAYVTDPVTLLALRMVFSLPFFLAAAAWMGRSRDHAPMSRRDAVAIVLLGFLGYYFASFLDFLGLQYISAGLGRLILFLYPTVVMALSFAFLGKRPSPPELLALVLSYIGLALVLANTAGTNVNLALGAALVFGSAAAYAVYLVAGSAVVQRVGSMRFSAYATTIASAFCIAQFFLLRPVSALHLPPQVYGLAIAMAIASTVLPVFLTSEALRRIGANRVALVGALGPVTTIFFGWLGLDEAMTPVQLLGAMLVLGGVLLVSLRR
jgi:drug/metabolite transporter (DMT)-like permease